MYRRAMLTVVPFLILITSCKDSKLIKENQMTTHKHTNQLSTESSPYLLQHQHNPVNWIPYSDEVFEKAKKENKLVLISIGYSACHWCHVMEKESFENEDVAEVMNANFICVKVDREERPDVDQVYMNAVQLMTQRGGWPLNCFTLPDGRPIYGGTYFPKDQWVHILKTLAETYKTDEAKFLEYAERLHEGMMVSELIDTKAKSVAFSKEKLDELIVVWKRSFDRSLGGNNRAPKFPMPNNYEFLLNYAATGNDAEVEKHVLNTLNHMAWGGIYDQIGGGFSRYAVDIEWKVPHFEKMLYDNGQLMKLYSEAYQFTKDEEYKKVIYQTHDWLEREMRLKNGAYYAALDADSEGEEGKFYIWKKDELQELLTEEEFDFIEDVYNINSKGYWEHDNYILLRKTSIANLAKERNVSPQEFSQELSRIDKKLLAVRNQRIAPGLDDKSLTSWNALLVSGYIQAYKAFQDSVFLDRATSCLNWILNDQIQSNGKLWHTYKNNVSKIDGFLEDYAAVIDACLATYEVTMDERYLKRGVELLEKAIEEFYDMKSGMFWFTDNDSKLVVRKMEISDNVIPASNSIMARNLWHAYLLTDNPDYKSKAEQMLTNVYEGMHTYGSGYSNWASLLMQLTQPKREIVVVGPNAKQILSEINQYYLPNVLVVGSEYANELPLFKGRFKEGKTLIYFCENNACQLPVHTVEELRKLIRK